MKKIILLIIVLLSNIGVAQISYLSTDYALQNESFIVSTATVQGLTLDYVQTGTNFDWNYSTLVPATQETVLYQNPNNAGYRTVWCFINGFIFNCNTQFNNNFNLATKLTNGIQIQGFGITNVIDHLKLSSTLLEDKMIGASITVNGTSVPFVASYQTADKIYQFPINYNDNYTNNFALSVDLNSFGVPIQYASTGQRNNLVEGWGSLTTPFGTFPNVLKMKTTVVNNITITTNDTPTQNTVTTVSYKWFDKAYGIPVMQVEGNVVANQFVPNTVTYFDIQRCLTPNAAFAFLPLASDFNPTSNNASVSFINLSNNYDTVSWNFGDGSAASTAVNPTHNYSCPGVKQVTLTITNAFCTPEQTDTITIPVTINDTQNAFTTSVTQTPTSLTADRTLAGTTYQWLDCDNSNAPINGQTGQTFTPTVSGNYAVQLTSNGCQSVSDCYLFSFLNSPDFNLNASISVYPNPTTGEILVANSESITIQRIGIYSVIGTLVTETLDLTGHANGIYFIKIETDKGLLVKKIIKN
ncbi:PKD domain-containing protein [Flavobacterium sp.]|jgi:PKD repeat protein|uniref:PKD domain-containing protein n=1 Tax=Flavobacterium sp. TaxID=239 RepID=UPI0037C06B84